MSTYDPIFGCEFASGRTDRDGYAFHGKTRAHIHAWEQVNGIITALDEQGRRLELDHMCRRRNCKALHHLELVTRSENEKRKSWRYRAKRTRCPQGHDLKTNGAITPEGGIVCRQCNREAQGART